MIKVNYIKTMDFTFEDIIVLNCDDVDEINCCIKDNIPLTIKNGKDIEYINSSYIMFYKLD